MRGEAQVMLQEILRKEVVQVPPLPATYTLVLQRVCLSSVLAAMRFGATPSFSSSQHDRGAAPAGRERHFRASSAPGQLERAQLRGCYLGRFGDKGKRDSRISTLALVNPHSKIFFNSHLSSS